MTKMSQPASLFAVFAILAALLAAPAFAITASKGDGGMKKMNGAGFVLLVSLQRNSA